MFLDEGFETLSFGDETPGDEFYEFSMPKCSVISSFDFKLGSPKTRSFNVCLTFFNFSPTL